MPKLQRMEYVTLVLLVGLCFAAIALGSGSKQTDEIARISVEDARKSVDAGQALLVCAYDDETCRDKMLQGALLRSEFETKVAGLDKDQEIIFYCG